MAEVFLSHQHESKEIINQICQLIEKNDIKCWVAPRDVKIEHSKEIIEAIEKCKVFIIFEDENVSSIPRDDIINEISFASNLSNKGELNIIRYKLTTNSLESKHLLYYIGRLQYIDGTQENAELNLVQHIKKILNGEIRTNDIIQPTTKRSNSDSNACQRHKNDYFKYSNQQEKKRLILQQEFLTKFDSDVYKRLLKGKKNLAVLDLGTNTGDMIMNRLGKCDSVNTIIGLDISKEAVNDANEKYKNTKGHFYQLDIESNDFITTLKNIMKDHNITKFDFINISMLLLHLENPRRLIHKIQSVTNKGGIFFIRDIDDGLNLAYPDINGNFNKAFEICSRNHDSGYRKSGREIPTILSTSELKNIKLEKMCLNSIGMDYDEKDALFDIYFSFILEDAKARYQANPDVRINKSDYEWIKDNYDDLQTEFHNRDFFFNLGFITFSAIKA